MIELRIITQLFVALQNKLLAFFSCINRNFNLGRQVFPTDLDASNQVVNAEPRKRALCAGFFHFQNFKSASLSVLFFLKNSSALLITLNFYHFLEKFSYLKTFYGLKQGFPNWGTCTRRGTFRLLKGYIIM